MANSLKKCGQVCEQEEQNEGRCDTHSMTQLTPAKNSKKRKSTDAALKRKRVKSTQR